MKKLLREIAHCRVCAAEMSVSCRPIVAAARQSKILIIGQAPGSIVHRTGIPWDDKSGDNLRQWMGVDKDAFYDTQQVAIVPMGFCYPGKGKSGDLAPRKECAPLWHKPLLDEMPDIALTLLIGKYAQDYYLGSDAYRTLTETVRHYETYLPQYFVLPHPSPRNNIWMKQNEWFKVEVLPALRDIVQANVR